ncbi:HugZ family protein [Magnetospirillum sp. UT-4]|uniref:HugZ family pyridoxamine 5'-phosphate oxidase n=1 Tax=Magnetospirillum sp. UT-4 TaxID=2681467 RepID=UPI001380853A|nr:DUF2470 domain-containing protein [Magnetospirillum sp. UT-4]CAA7617572.1 putative heme iron utilization protein [Magnetospirillum sp. UT-4]
MNQSAAHDPGQLPADNRRALRQVARAARKAALATVLAESGGAPYASLVTVALDHDFAPILLLSGLADHSRNIAADARVSLLFDGTDGHPNPQTGPRVTLTGRAARSDDPRLKARFLARHPGAAMYADFGDFGFWRVEPERAHFVGGFARAVWFDAPFGLSPAVADLAAAEADMLAHMNDHHADSVDRIARVHGGAEGSGWHLAGLDPDGIDLTREERFLRIAFPAPAEGAEAAKAALIALARGGAQT